VAAVISPCGFAFTYIAPILNGIASRILAGTHFRRRGATQLFHAIQSELRLSGDAYPVWIKAAAVAVFCYIGLTDFRRFKVPNLSLALLVLLYALYAAVAHPLLGTVFDVVLGTLVFLILLWFYSKGALGGGDVKLLPLACLWVGTQNTVLFSLFLLFFILVHLAAVKVGWAAVRFRGARWAIPYAPSICGAVVATVLVVCF